jgi:hypothetical protein
VRDDHRLGVVERCECDVDVVVPRGADVIYRQVDGDGAVTKSPQFRNEPFPAPAALEGAVQQAEGCRHKNRI